MSMTKLDLGERLAAANGLTLCYQTFGAPSDPPILLVMGLGAQMIWWEDDLCESLAARGFHVVRFDNRDVGKSTQIDAPPPDLARAFAGFASFRPPYTLEDMARDTVGLLDALKIPNAHVVGASMGGMIAQLVAIHFPERVKTLTSIMSNTGSRGLPGPRPEVWSAMTAPPPRTVDEYIEANVKLSRLLRGYDDAGEARDARARAERSASRGLCPAGGLRQSAAILAGEATARRRSVRWNIPTLVIHGVDDPLVTVESGRATARAIPGAKLVLLERMGHTLPRALWPTFVEAIADARGLAQPPNNSATLKTSPGGSSRTSPSRRMRVSITPSRPRLCWISTLRSGSTSRQCAKARQTEVALELGAVVERGGRGGENFDDDERVRPRDRREGAADQLRRRRE